MGDIKLSNLQDAKRSALYYLSNLKSIRTEEFCFAVMVLMQLINCMIYKVEGNVARLTVKNIQSRCRSNRIKVLLTFRNTVCHLYGTEEYHNQLDSVVTLFGENYYDSLLEFIQDIVLSVNNGIFVDRFGVRESTIDSVLNEANRR